MKKLNRFVSTCVLPLFLLIGGNAALALDTDGDGVPSDITVAAGSSADHTCALDGAGLHCWGENSYGQSDVPALTNPTAVGVGSRHTCAIDDDGVHGFVASYVPEPGAWLMLIFGFGLIGAAMRRRGQPALT